MISKVCLYENNITYCAKVPNVKPTKICSNMEKALTGETIINKKVNDKISLIDKLKDIFFEAFPNLDGEYKKIIRNQKNRM